MAHTPNPQDQSIRSSRTEPDTATAQLPDRAYELGYSYEHKYGYCAQCVLVAIKDAFGFVADDVIQSAHALSGGLAATGGGTCGALAGGAMALCCRYGRDMSEFDQPVTKRPEELCKRLYDMFVETYGSPICAGVQKAMFGRTYDLWNPDEYEAFERAGAHRDKCPQVVGNVARWVAEILVAEGS